MKIKEILARGITVSCELFPPKKESELSDYHRVVAEMAKVRPSFMSVTYGASGGTSDYTVDIANEVQNRNGVPALAHLTCLSSDRQKIASVLEQLKVRGIENVLALRGDRVEGVTPPADRYEHASDLTSAVLASGDFCVGGACYPEGHPESPGLRADIENLRYKVDAGVSFLTSQMFFDNTIFYRYLLELHRVGIHVPVIAGIMPVTNAKQILRITSLSGTVLPQRFRMIVERFGDDPAAMQQAGIAYATDQIIDLLANGVEHIHIYTMNRPQIAARIFENLSSIIPNEH